MAVALYKLIQSPDPRKKQAIKIFAIQLIMNAAWSFFFFQFHWLAFSLAEILTLLLTLISFCVITEPFCRAAMYCFLPYIAWVGFATLLNASILYLN